MKVTRINDVSYTQSLFPSITPNWDLFLVRLEQLYVCPHGALLIGQRKDSILVGDTMSFLGVTYRSMGDPEELLHPKACPTMMTVHRNPYHGALGPSCRQLH